MLTFHIGITLLDQMLEKCKRFHGNSGLDSEIAVIIPYKLDNRRYVNLYMVTNVSPMHINMTNVSPSNLVVCE